MLVATAVALTSSYLKLKAQRPRLERKASFSLTVISGSLPVVMPAVTSSGAAWAMTVLPSLLTMRTRPVSWAVGSAAKLAWAKRAKAAKAVA